MPDTVAVVEYHGRGRGTVRTTHPSLADAQDAVPLDRWGYPVFDVRFWVIPARHKALPGSLVALRDPT